MTAPATAPECVFGTVGQRAVREPGIRPRQGEPGAKHRAIDRLFKAAGVVAVRCLPVGQEEAVRRDVQHLDLPRFHGHNGLRFSLLRFNAD